MEKVYCVALPWVLVGNGAKMRLEIITIFFIVEYAFILLEGMEDFSFSNLSGKFGVRLTCITSNVKSFLQVLHFYFPKSLKKTYCICICTRTHIFILEYVILHRWQQICCIFHAQLKRNFTRFPCIMERSASVPHLIRSILIMLNVFWLLLRKFSKYTWRETWLKMICQHETGEL